MLGEKWNTYNWGEKLANCEMFKLRYLKTSSRIWLSTVGSIVMSKEKWKNHGIYWGGKLDNWKLQYCGFFCKDEANQKVNFYRRYDTA